MVRDVTENTLKPMARDAAPKIEDAAQRFTQEVLQPAAKELAAKLEPGAQVRLTALPMDSLWLPATCVGTCDFSNNQHGRARAAVRVCEGPAWLSSRNMLPVLIIKK